MTEPFDIDAAERTVSEFTLRADDAGRLAKLLRQACQALRQAHIALLDSEERFSTWGMKSELLIAEAKALLAEDRAEQAESRVAKLREALEGIAFNTSSSMPAAWNDELSWYMGQFSSCIGQAARALAEDGEK